MKIGILGGTFDPIHLGHMELAEAALKDLELGKLVFMPCSIPPHKNRKDIAPAKDRLEMVELAIEGRPEYKSSDYEVRRGGASFSVETLADLKKAHPGDEIFFIIGSDSYKEFSTWKDYDKIPKLVKIAVAERPSYAYDSLGEGMIEIQMKPSPVSSSKIRSILRKGGSIQGLVPERVRSYIARKRLYGAKA